MGAPEIASQFILAWVGGSIMGADEYNEYTDQSASDFVLADPERRIYTEVDTRMILGDLFACLRLAAVPHSELVGADEVGGSR